MMLLTYASSLCEVCLGGGSLARRVCKVSFRDLQNKSLRVKCIPNSLNFKFKLKFQAREYRAAARVLNVLVLSKKLFSSVCLDFNYILPLTINLLLKCCLCHEIILDYLILISFFAQPRPGLFPLGLKMLLTHANVETVLWMCISNDVFINVPSQGLKSFMFHSFSVH